MKGRLLSQAWPGLPGILRGEVGSAQKDSWMHMQVQTPARCFVRPRENKLTSVLNFQLPGLWEYRRLLCKPHSREDGILPCQLWQTHTQAPPNVPKRTVRKVMSTEEKVRLWASLTSWPWRLE